MIDENVMGWFVGDNDEDWFVDGAKEPHLLYGKGVQTFKGFYALESELVIIDSLVMELNDAEPLFTILLYEKAAND